MEIENAALGAGQHEPGATADAAQHLGDAKATPLADANPRHARHLALVILPLIVALSLLVLFFLLPRVSTDDAHVEAHISAISSRVSGYVTKVAVNDNQNVRAGQLLVELDPRDYQAAVDQARGAYMVALAQAEEARRDIRLTRDTTTTTTVGSIAQRQGAAAELSRSQTSYVQAATASLDEAKANLIAKETVNARAQSDLKRYQILLASQDVSQLQFDAIAATARVSQADVLTAQKQVLGAQQAVEIAGAQAEDAKSALEGAQASLSRSVAEQQQVPIRVTAYQSALAEAGRTKAVLDEALLQLQYTRVLAPIDGQVTERSVDVGQYVTPEQQLMTVVPLQHVYIVANFKETQLARVRVGQRVKIHADEYRGVTFWGTVNSIAAATGSVEALLPPQNATGNFVKVVQRIPVKILVDPPKNGQAVLRPGMNVEVVIHVH